MLTTNKIRNFLATITQEEEISLQKQINELAKCLKARIRMVNKTGAIIYEANFSTCNLQNVNQQLIPIISKGKTWGMLIVSKDKLTLIEHIVLEMEAGLISLYLN